MNIYKIPYTELYKLKESIREQEADSTQRLAIRIVFQMLNTSCKMQIVVDRNRWVAQEIYTSEQTGKQIVVWQNYFEDPDDKDKTPVEVYQHSTGRNHLLIDSVELLFNPDN